MAAMASAAAASLDRLSDLPDDVLIHILSFIPTREAARTTALSRRWRCPLWIYTGAINLDYRHYSTGAGGIPLRMRAVDDADLALSFQNSIGRGPPKKVALVMRDGTMHDDILRAACRREEDEDDEDEDTSGVEELRLECLEYGVPSHCIHAAPSGWAYYDLSLVSLPFAGLRVLELTGCILHTRSPSPSSQESSSSEEDESEEEEPEQGEERCITFPSLEALRLRRCRTPFNTLQDMVLAAPWLADLLLEAVSFTEDHYTHHLRCPAATSITMANCHKLHTDNLPFLPCIMELDAPRLLRLSYSQVHTFNFKEASHTCFPYDDSWSAPPDLEQVHLALLTASEAAGLRRSMLRSVSGVRVLILTLYSLADLADYGLPYFYNLKRLEIEELCGCIVNHREAARAIDKMLRRCPALRHLHLRFRWREYLAEAGDPADQIAAMEDLTPCRSINNTGYDDDEEDCCESLDLCYQHSARDLDCLLKGSLKRVVVEFDAEELTCFQVRLIRFLAREAAGLEEVVVDGGKGYNSSRIDRKVERWRRKWKRSPPTKSVAPLWPLSLSEFPLPLKAPAAPTPLTPTSSHVEVHNGLQFYDDDGEEETDYEDDVSPRHFIRGGRKKKKKGGTLECFSVKAKAKDGLITVRSRRGGANRRRRRDGWDWFVEEGDIEGSSASTHIVPAISTPQRPPTMSEFPSLLPPSPPVRRSLPSLFEPSAVDRASSSAAECPSQDAQVGSCPTDTIGALREWRAVRLADLEVTTGMTSRHRYLPRRRPLAPTMPSGRRCTAAFRIHQP